jgi:zinc and cadmium transporter
LITFFLLISSVWIGVFIAKLIPQTKNFNKFLLIFTGSFILGILLLDLIPSLFIQNTQTAYSISLIMILGILFQILLEWITKGIEHGHIHTYNKRTFYVVFIGLFIHSFLEGIPIKHFENLNKTSFNLLITLFLHNIPIAIILYYILNQIFENKTTQILFLLAFSLSAPLGSIIGNIWFISINHYLLAFICGTLLHISTLILFESSKNHQYNFKILVSILLGIGLALFSTI